jgi:hypothetical protein
MSLYPKIGAAAGCLLILATTHGFVHRAGQNSVQIKWEAAKVAHAHALAAQESRHRATERKWGEATALLTESLRGAQERLRDDYETTIADIESGALRLRGDLAGCRARVPTATSPAEGDHGSGDSGLSEARQRVALSIGRDADRVALRLQACQQYIRTIQASP